MKKLVKNVDKIEAKLNQALTELEHRVEVSESKYCQNCNSEKEFCMCLPEGKTCNDCSFFDGCMKFGITEDGQTHCDWWPIKFI